VKEHKPWHNLFPYLFQGGGQSCAGSRGGFMFYFKEHSHFNFLLILRSSKAGVVLLFK